MLFKTVFFILGHAAARPTDTQSMPADEIANQGTEPVLPGVDFSRAPFGGKCRRISLTGGGKVGKTTLEGLCADEKGREWVTGLNLNQCIGNNAGKMVYKDGGNFDNECRPCILDVGGDVDLKCNCLNDKGVPQYTVLRMGTSADEYAVRLVDGVFVCGRHRGTASPADGE